MVAAQQGQEEAFLSAVRRILHRIREANLLTSPNREDLLRMSDDDLLRLAEQPNTFLGEEYCTWNGRERLVRNSSKTVAKLLLSLRAEQYTNRSFASTVSLILFALHTTQINPAKAFKLLRAYRGVYRQVTRGHDWDEPMLYLDPGVKQNLHELGNVLCQNERWAIANVRRPTYEDHEYDCICYTDASAAGWGAIVQKPLERAVTTYQQKWIPSFHMDDARLTAKRSHHFSAKYSAHAEPRAVHPPTTTSKGGSP
eukprot:gene5814-biopygen3669